MLRKIISVLLLLVLLVTSVPTFTSSALAATPYYIVVDLSSQIVTVYSSADNSVVRQMLCSSGKNDSTPEGVFYLPKKRRTSERAEWYYFHTFQCWAKYATRIEGGILFHSIPYSDRRESTISKSGLKEFGAPASHGCIRLRADDSKFIAQNCLEGTPVKIYKSGDPQHELRELLYEASYTSENGLSYNDYLGMPEDPNSLGRFSTGPEVEDLQYRLRALGFFSDEVSGSYRNSTINAVKQVQRVLGLPENGYTSPELMETIMSADAPTAMNVNLSEGMSGPVVRKLQTDLLTLRLYNGDIDGIYDVDVVAAVNTFQSVYGYSVSSVATTEVQKAIYYEAGKISALFVNSDYTCELASDTMPVAIVSSSVRVRVRAKPSINSNALDKVYDGTQLFVLEYGDTWSKIQYNGNVGYIKNVFLEFTGLDISRLKYTSTDGGRIYTIGSTLDEYRSGAQLPSSTFAAYLASEGSLEDYEGIVDFITVNTGAENVKLNLRANPSSSANVLAELDNGTQLRVMLQSSEWTLVEYESQAGYLLNDYLDFWSGPEDALESGYEPETYDDAETEETFQGTVSAIVQAPGGGNANVYDLDSDDASQIGYLPHNTQVTIVKADDEWSLIDFQGHQGYMRNENLQFILTDL